MLSIQALDKSFQQPVLQNITMHVADREIVALLGPSGSGKSTLLQCIGGVLPIDAGHIMLNNQSIAHETGHISYMPQHHSLLPWRTVLQNVLIAQQLTGSANEQEAIEWIERIGLAAYTHAYPHEISGGMKQRISFLRALLSEQSLLCLDEPFSALDELTRHDMHIWLLKVWQQRQKSILMITHNIDEAIFLAHRIYVLSPKPATIQAELMVPFGDERTHALLHSAEFFALRTQILQLLMEGSHD